MRDFLDYLQEEFVSQNGGNVYDNSYSSLDLSARSLLSFSVPAGSRVTLSSLIPPYKFGTSYSIGIKDGWISYLYSTHALGADTVSRSDRIPLSNLLRCYRHLSNRPVRHAVGHSLIYGRIYLPQSRLEALVASRVTPEIHLTARAVSQKHLPQGGTMLGAASFDDPAGRFGLETLASTDGGIFGLRGLWNATPPHADPPEPAPEAAANDKINGRFSLGGEIYYGFVNKSGGFSCGGRFQSTPAHQGTPLTATMTFNLLGQMSATYAVTAGDCTLATGFGFNLYSYESDWAVGMELWRKKRPAVAAPLEDAPGGDLVEDATVANATGGFSGVDVDPVAASQEQSTATEDAPPATLPPLPLPPPTKTRMKERSFQAKLEWRLDEDEPSKSAGAATTEEVGDDNEDAGVVRCRCNQDLKVGLLYEGRYKSLLFSVGSDVDLRKLDAPFRGVGLEVQFSS